MPCRDSLTLPCDSDLQLFAWFWPKAARLFRSLRTSHQAILPSHHHFIFPLPLLERVSCLFSASVFFSSMHLLSFVFSGHFELHMRPSQHHSTFPSPLLPCPGPSHDHTTIKSYNDTMTPAYHHTITPCSSRCTSCCCCSSPSCSFFVRAPDRGRRRSVAVFVVARGSALSSSHYSIIP